MIICPECGEQNPQGSKFCRKCGINLVYEEPEVEKKTAAKKVTVEDDTGPIRKTTVNTNSGTNATNKKEDNKLWACCICIVFIFIIFAIFGH